MTTIHQHPAARAHVLGVGPGTLGAVLWLGTAEQLRRLRHYRRRVLTQKDPEDLHQLRVSLRRLRAALEAGHEALDLPDAARPEVLAHLGRSLGGARDADVLLAELTPLVPFAKGAEADALAELLCRLRERRRRARRTVRRVLTSAPVVTCARLLRRWVRQPQFFPAAFGDRSRAAPRLVAPLEAAVASHPGWAVSARAAGTLAAEEHRLLHDLRKQIKNLRYRIELLHREPAADRHQRLAQLEAVQDCLGALRDVEQAGALITRSSRGLDPNGPPLVRRHLAARRAAVLAAWSVMQPAGYRGMVSTADGAA